MGYDKLVHFVEDLAHQNLLYNRLSAFNMLLIFVRPLQFVRDSPRMAKLNQTLYEASVDIKWFLVIMGTAVSGFVLFAHITFGPHLMECSEFYRAFQMCFEYILGKFDYWTLSYADPYMAAIFFIPYLLLCYC